MSPGDSGYGFGYAEVAGGRYVVVTTKDLDALLGWHAQLPLILRRRLLEV